MRVSGLTHGLTLVHIFFTRSVLPVSSNSEGESEYAHKHYDEGQGHEYDLL